MPDELKVISNDEDNLGLISTIKHRDAEKLVALISKIHIRNNMYIHSSEAISTVCRFSRTLVYSISLYLLSLAYPLNRT